MKRKAYVISISIVTVICIIWGSIYHIGGLMDGDFSFRGFFFGEKTKKVSKDVEIEDFSSINIKSEIMDVEIQKGDQFKLHYECNKEKLIPKYSIEGGVLKIEQKGSGGFSLFSSGSSCKAVITVPDGKTFSDISIVSNTGDFIMGDVITEKIDVETDTGDFIIKNSNLGNTKIDTDTGDIIIENSVMADMKMVSDTGDVEISGTTLAGIDIESDTGDISIKGGFKMAEYNKSIETDTGDITVNGSEQGSKYNNDATEGSGKSLRIKTDTGDVTLSE